METIIKPFQLGIAASLLENYKGDIPFSNYFTEQCKLHRNWGSRDRKIYRQACYAYLRLGHAIQEGSTESNIRFAMQPVQEILSQIDLKSIYPHPNLLSEQVSFNEWAKSLLVMKPVYIALVKGNEKKTEDFLKEKSVEFTRIHDRAIKVDPSTNCNEIIENGWGWIMDISSQETAGKITLRKNDKVWDCCSGAGGKALYMTNSGTQPIYLTCSDARFSVLQNLKERFKKCNLPVPSIELCDLKSPFQRDERYDVIVADVPCTGSGTWGRTPENITRTDLEKIVFYSKLQRTIIDNARKNLAVGGRLYYITCSVFKEENESNVKYFEEKSGLKSLRHEYVNAAGNQSDWLYISELLKY